MKTSTIVLLGVIGAGAYFLFTKNNVSADNYVPLYEAMPYSASVMTASANATEKPVYKTAVDTFLNTPVNTPKSIKSGVDVINTALKEGVQLPRLSGTISKVTQNSNIARLADGSIKQVTVKSVSNSYFDKPIKTINGVRTRNY